MNDQYAAFASDYDWLFSDFRRVGDRHVVEAAPWLARTESPRILDCACGTGLFALALARHGHRVVGTDASPPMIRRARENAAREGLTCPLTVCAWQDLPGRFESEFDLVFCGGNSIGHCRDEAEMVASLAAMQRVLRPDGVLIVETREWEKVLADRIRFSTFGQREREGTRCIPLYVWSFGEDDDAPVGVEVVLPFEVDGAVTLRSYAVTYHPFTTRQLVHRMRQAGLADVRTEPKGPGAYRAVGSVAADNELVEHDREAV